MVAIHDHLFDGIKLPGTLLISKLIYLPKYASSKNSNLMRLFAKTREMVVFRYNLRPQLQLSSTSGASHDHLLLLF